MKTVYIVGYDPINNQACVGGFLWYFDKRTCLDVFLEYAEENTHFLWYREHTFAKDLTHDEINNAIQDFILNQNSDGDWV